MPQLLGYYLIIFQAWCKFTECIIQYRLMDVQGYEPNTSDSFHSAHLCEAPGAFITALNHYIKTQDNDHRKRGIVVIYDTLAYKYYHGALSRKLPRTDLYEISPPFVISIHCLQMPKPL